MAKKPEAMSDDDDDNNNAVEHHPIIVGLLHELPAPGDVFAADRRKLWMQILDLVLQLIYPEEEES